MNSGRQTDIHTHQPVDQDKKTHRKFSARAPLDH